MKLLFYTAADNVGNRIQEIIETVIPRQRLETYQTMNGLASRLRQPFADFRIAILIASSKEELFEFLSIHELLSGLKIIIILPDREHDTIAKALRLRPRFLTFYDGDFNEVSAVLCKMLKSYSRESHPFERGLHVENGNAICKDGH